MPFTRFVRAVSSRLSALNSGDRVKSNGSVTGYFSLAGLLPLLFLVSVGLVRRTEGADTPLAIIDAFVAWVAVSYLSAELLGFFRSIAFLPILVAWLLALGLVALRLVSSRPSVNPEKRILPLHLALSIIASFAAISLFIALTAEPNNWDSQTYHLPRIEHWLQNGSLEHYPTAIGRQIAYAPLAEILLLQTRVLAGADTFYLLVQWVSMLCCISSVFRITKQLGGNETQSWIAAVFIATLPMGILQSTSTQTDYVTAALLCCFVSLGLEAIEKSALRPATLLEALTAGALTGIVKPAGYMLGAGFAVWLSLVLVSRLTIASLVKWGLTAALILAIVVGPFAARNLPSAYRPMQTPAWAHPINASFGPKQSLDNLILNIALNLATGIPRVDRFTTNSVLRATGFLGLDTYRADTLSGNLPFSLPTGRYLTHEDLGPNPVHTLLILAALGVTIARWREIGSPLRLKYWCAWFLGLVVFVSMLKWQPFIARYHISGFALAAPVAVLAWRQPRLPARSTVILLVVLAIAGLPALLFNLSRQLVPLPRRPSYLFQQPLQRLFVNRQDIQEPYVNAVDRLVQAEASQIGLVIGGDHWEYPLWRMLRDRRLNYRVRIEHVNIRIRNREIEVEWPLGPFLPDALVWTRANPPPQVEIAGREFVRQDPPGAVTVYLSAATAPK